PSQSHGTGKRVVDFIALLLLICVASIAASMGVYTWLTPTSPQAPVAGQFYTSSSQSVLSSEFMVQFEGVVATVYASRATKSTAPVEQSYLAAEALGQALVLSSDGWFVTTQAVVPEARAGYVVVLPDGRAYTVEAVALDPVAPLVYLKAAVRNLTATPFAAPEELAPNVPVAAVTVDGQGTARSWYLGYLANIEARTPVASRADLAVGSETLPDRYLLDRVLPAGSRGAPVVTLGGKVVGLVGDYGGSLRAVVPLGNLAGVIETLFANQPVRRSLLGVTYVQSTWLSLPAGEEQAATGALLVPGARRAAVVAKSPAAQAGLREGDSIVAVDGRRLNGASLSLVLQRYRAGGTLELTVRRDGAERAVAITLGEVLGGYYTASAE
ncbi:MAG: S1C family serine protease, partial [Candidatus Veblenbacteria bacterium]|nr:S1C family serine protease [Candidatus Veblenbacteria bacterium]